MKRLILNPTDVAQWHALVNEALDIRTLSLDEDLESYLVFLLMRYINRADIGGEVLGLDFLKGAQAKGSRKVVKLQGVGDRCLLFSGLFPGRGKRFRVETRYYIDLGQSAYGMLEEETKTSASALFAALRDDFVLLMEVLQSIRKMGDNGDALLPLDAFDLMEVTKGRCGAGDLEVYTKGNPVLPGKKTVQ